MPSDDRKTAVMHAAGLSARAMLDAAAGKDQRWMRRVLEKLGTAEAKMVLRQLQRWTPEQWPRS